jgi:hypothetical protein
MTQDLFSTLIPIALIGLIALVVGVVIGFLLAALSRPSSAEDEKKKKTMAEIARLWRDRKSGKVSVEINRKLYTSPSEMRAEQQAALSKALDELQLWLGGDDLVARALVTPEPLPASQKLSTPPFKPASEPQAASLVAASSVTQTYFSPPEPEVKPPSMQIGDILSQAFTTDKSKAAKAPAKSIAAQVDEIIQEKLPGSPFKNRIISVTELPGRGLLVRVDDLSYEGIADVADPEIRQFLRDCVSEWEHRSEHH